MITDHRPRPQLSLVNANATLDHPPGECVLPHPKGVRSIEMHLFGNYLLRVDCVRAPAG